MSKKCVGLCLRTVVHGIIQQSKYTVSKNLEIRVVQWRMDYGWRNRCRMLATKMQNFPGHDVAAVKLYRPVYIDQWRRKRGRRTLDAKRRKLFLSCPSTFLALHVQLVVFCERFRDGQYILAVSCLLFFYSRCPPPRAEPFVKVGTCPCALWSRRHWM